MDEVEQHKASGKSLGLSQRSIETMKPGDRIFDAGKSSVSGLFIRYRGKNGAKHFGLVARVHNKQRWFSLGAYGSPLTVDMARKRAREIQASIDKGLDPAAEREQSKLVLTVREVAERFLAEHCGVIDSAAAVQPERGEKRLGPIALSDGALVKAGTARGYATILCNHVVPTIGKLRVDGVSTPDIAGLHHRMRKTPRAANHMLSCVSVMVSWASARRLWPKGSIEFAEIGRFKENRRERVLSADEIKRVIEAINAAEAGVDPANLNNYKAAVRKKHVEALQEKLRAPGIAAGQRKRLAAILARPQRPVSISPWSAAALRFLLLTGLRPAEALNLRWVDVDMKTGTASLRDSKTGARQVALSSHALEVLDTVHMLHDNPYIFCSTQIGKLGIHKSREGRPLSSLQHSFELVRELAQLPADVVLYTARHNFGSTLAADRAEVYEIMKAMGHKNVATTMRYIHQANTGVQSAVNKATGGIAAAMGLGKQADRPSADIVQIRTAKA
jgi:integrase